MRHVAYSIRGALILPVLICLFFLFKAFCPSAVGSSCFADHFSVPIFLPLVAIYKMFGDSSVIGGQDFLFVIIYWAFVGFLLGLVFELWKHGSHEHKGASVFPLRPLDPSQLLSNMPPVKPVAPKIPIVTIKPPINLLNVKEEKSL